jgi:hypothetical protein
MSYTEIWFIPPLTLNAIFNEGEYADKVVARALKKDKRWGL